MTTAGLDDERIILCLNSGSSSVKFALFQCREPKERLLARGAVERIGLQAGLLRVLGPAKEILAELNRDFADHNVAVHAALDALASLNLPRPEAVGHRLVHGGAERDSPTIVDPRLLADLKKLIAFAPLHLPAEIKGIEAVSRRFPGILQVACFDTAFHRRLPEMAQRFPLPRTIWDHGVRKYGFHGLSYEYILDVLGEAARGRTIIAHLGNGASMAAVRDGQPLDTTMGFTPTGGLMMGTRCGDLDPGILLYLFREKGRSVAGIEDLVNHQSGLLGVSGISSDMKTLLEMKNNDPRASLAVEMFCYHARKHIGALAAVLEGLETLVFTGGIGERAAPVRRSVCRGLAYLGIKLDPALNESHAGTISTAGSSCKVLVVPTDEDLMIARHTYNVSSDREGPGRSSSRDGTGKH
ncbi:acetate kinase [bacterium BMS3Bbin14]|nr:acetate kinase [bacterium BMS3Abin13]GBE53822.1 acetate kinase [bacterium BMS3Bbin14]